MVMRDSGAGTRHDCAGGTSQLGPALPSAILIVLLQGCG